MTRTEPAFARRFPFFALATFATLAGAPALAGCSSSSTPAYTAPADTGTTDTSAADTNAADTNVADTSGTDASDASDASTSHTVHVGASGLAFTPSTLTIATGDSVTWVFDSIGHTVTSGTGGTADGKFCSPSDTGCASGVTSAVGATYSHVFATAGSYPYFCAIHFASGMTGTITVSP